jgi:hypothetical protein
MACCFKLFFIRPHVISGQIFGFTVAELAETV